MEKRDKLALTGLCIGYSLIMLSGLLRDIALGTSAWAATVIIVMAMWAKIK